MAKKVLLLIIGVFVVTAATLLAFAFISSEETDEEIQAKLRCDRVTAEYLITDYYCDNLDDYRKDLANDDLLDNDWSYQFGQQELERRGYTE